MTRRPAGKDASAEEGRYQRRLPIQTAVRLRCEDWTHFQTEYAGNISEGGIFIQTEQPLPTGTMFRLEVSIGGETVLTKAQVIWTKEFSPKEKRPSGMGARFLEMDDDSRARLKQWLDEAAASAPD